MIKLEDIDFDQIMTDLKDMEQECIVLFDSNCEVGLHNHGDNYYEAQAEFDELSKMTDEELKQQDIMAYAYMSCYELVDTGSREDTDIDILPQIYDACDKVGFILAHTNGFYDGE